MDYKDLDTVIESQVKFVKENSNSISNRVNILNSLFFFSQPSAIVLISPFNLAKACSFSLMNSY